MILEDEELLDRFRGQGRCECCGQMCKERDACHLIPRGLGGDGRVDIAGNVVSLRRWCHAHQGLADGPSLDCLKRIVAKRECVEWSDIEQALWAVQRLPKCPKAPDVERCLGDIAVVVRPMIESALKRWRERLNDPLKVVRERKEKKEKPAWYVEAQKRQKAYRKEAYKRWKAKRKAEANRG